MVTLDLADELTIDRARRRHGVDSPSTVPSPTVCRPDDSNLVRQGAAAAGRGAAVHVDKQIPHGGGLGGGSADAAAVLRWAGIDDLRPSAAELGADVPFCLVGGRARVSGIGEVVEPLPRRAATVTLVVPPLHVSTPAVYRAWDELGGPSRRRRNDLEPAALVVGAGARALAGPHRRR